MSEKTTNGEWIERFEAELKRRFHGRSTAKHYGSDLRVFIRERPAPLIEVTSEDIALFVDGQRSSGMAPATVKRRVAALKTFFDFLARELGQPRRPNPVSLRRHAGRLPQLLPRDLSDSEVARFLAALDEPRDRAMFALMLYAGLRVGEVAGLTPGDIAVPAEGAAPIRLRVMGKGRKERVAYLSREGYRPLQRYLEGRVGADAWAPLFQNRFGRPITVAGIQGRIACYAERSGVEVTCHRLRHTYGRWMAEGEMPVLTLSRLLGHSSVQTTQRYIDGADPQLSRGYEAAMERRSGAVAEAAVAPETAAPTAVARGTATVIRSDPSFDAAAAWLSEEPPWLAESCRAWLGQRWYEWKPSQRQHHAQIRLCEVRRFWRWQLEQRPFTSWAELTAADIAGYMAAALERGLAAKTVKTTVDRVYEILRYLQERGQLEGLPERPELALPDPLPRHLAAQEVLSLAESVARREERAEGADWLDLALYYLLGHGGLRISEALDLQVKDLDLSARRLRVREGKGRRDRVIPLTRKGCAVLARYLETVPHAGEDLVLSLEGRPLSYEEALSRIAELGREAGTSRLTPHRLRHTYATHLLNNGMSIEALRRLMGHENLNTTLIYARLADTTLEQQYRAAMDRVTTNPVNSM